MSVCWLEKDEEQAGYLRLFESLNIKPWSHDQDCLLLNCCSVSLARMSFCFLLKEDHQFSCIVIIFGMSLCDAIHHGISHFSCSIKSHFVVRKHLIRADCTLAGT
jgi:hypothetical protein